MQTDFHKANRIKPVHDKTYNKTCVTGNNSDWFVHPPSMAIVLVYQSLDSLEAVEDRRCNQQRFCSDCVDAQADASLRWLHKSYYRFCPVLDQLI